ncbi:MAG: carbohydrate ABC transporter permease [Acidimicrobiales bacterium]|jgi:multiple sugar transport system permease protein
MQVDVQANESPVAPMTVASAPRKNSLRSSRRRALRLGLLFVSPWIAGFLLFFTYPFFATIYYSFTDFNGVGAAHWIGFANYVNLFRDPLFKTSIFNTFYYTAIELPLSTVAALGLALLLNMNARGRAVYRTIFYIPSIVPIVASCMIFVWLFNPAAGIVNDLLIDAHMPSPDWFFSVAWSKPSFILLGLWGLGQPMVIYLAGLQAVPRDMYEVAALDGAGPWQRLRYITLPMISPVIFFNAILQLVLCIAYFTPAQVIESADIGGPGTSTMFYVQYLYEQAFLFLKLGYSSAMAFFLFVMSAVIMVLLFRSSSRWVYYASEQQ